MNRGIDVIPETVSVSPRVEMFTAPNSGPKTLEGTHTFVVGREEAYILDPGPAIERYQAQLADWVVHSSVRARGILLTHGHPDHAPGASLLKRMLSLPVIASPEMGSASAEQAGVDRRFSTGEVFRVDDDTLRVIPAPGHSGDHAVFWLETSRVLFSGDAILGRGTTLVAPPEGDMTLYMRSLEMMSSLQPLLIVPGHGPVVTNPVEKIQEYVTHRNQREREVLKELAARPSTVEELVARIYKDIDPGLRDLAVGSVQAQLLKLLSEESVEERDGRFRLRGGPAPSR